MAYRFDDTICALATARGGAARGIVRVSGPGALGCVKTLCADVSQAAGLLNLTRATCVSACLRVDDVPGGLPCDLYCWPGARSFTREPVVEIHTIGSPPLLEAVVRTLCRGGVRLAEPGEFTMRAFLAGRIDLTQAEAVLGVIDAQSDEQLSLALSQLAGGLSGPLVELRETLLDALADLEAGLDFTEEDITFISPAELLARIDASVALLAELVEQMRGRGLAADVPRVVLVGWPNVGKSSLFNALVAQPAAIVSEHSGTTRDYLTAEIDCAGMRCRLVDTAGIEVAEQLNSIEQRAQQLGGEQQQGADLQLFCVDASRPLNSWERGELARRPLAAWNCLVVATKGDEREAHAEMPEHLLTSSRTGRGIEGLKQAIAEVLRSQAEEVRVVAGTAERCRQSIELARTALQGARQLVVSEAGDELVATELRAALDAVGQVVGTVYTDDVLGRIFSRFCIGK